jgi:DNA-binding XRE family transcriptional regulator
MPLPNSRSRRKSPLERFNAFYVPEPNTGCWLWFGSSSGSTEYGCIWVGGRHVRAHRYSWEIANGPVPDGLLCLHGCDVPLCVNPKHLFLGTPQDNSTDMVRKNRQSRGAALALRGERNGRAKLSFPQVREIRMSTLAQRQLAAVYGVTRKTISRIKQRKRWRHVEVTAEITEAPK